MAIRTGIGVGAAQIADTSDILNAYGKQVAQQQRAQALQAEREAKAQAKYEEELADIMANIKTDGAREVDIPDITNAYNELKEFYSKSGSIKDKDKPLFRAEIMSRAKNIIETAARSKKLGSDILDISTDMAKNEWDYDPNAVTEIKEIFRTPLKQLGGRSVIDPLRYKRQADPTLLIKYIDATHTKAKEVARPNGQIVDRSGLKYGVMTADPKFVINSLVERIESDPQALQATELLYRRTFPNDTNPTREKLVGFLKDQYESRYDYDYLGGAVQPRVGKDDDDDDNYNYPIELNLPFAQETKTPGVVNVKDYTKLPLTKQNFAGSGYIDMATGAPASGVLDSSNDYEVVGVGNFPIITKGNMKGTLAQPRFAEKNSSAVTLKPMVHVQKITDGNVENLLIPYDRLPRSKKVNKGLSNFIPASGGSSAPTTQKSNIPSATRAEWKAAGWSDADINQGLKQGVIKVK